MNAEKCENCRCFYMERISHVNAAGLRSTYKEAKCRRYPPIMKEGKETWPKAKEDNWCGEYSRLKEY